MDGPSKIDGQSRAIDPLVWYALYTRPRHEKAVYHSLTTQGVDAFLPVHDVLSRWKDRRKWVTMPLFPGYLFVNVSQEDLWLVPATRGALNLISDGAGPVPVPEEQVLALRELTELPVPVGPWPYVRKGDRVVVKAGPLMGMEGYFVRRKNESKLVVSVDMLGRSVAAEVDAECVELIDPVMVAARG